MRIACWWELNDRLLGKRRSKWNDITLGVEQYCGRMWAGVIGGRVERNGGFFTHGKETSSSIQGREFRDYLQHSVALCLNRCNKDESAEIFILFVHNQ